MKKTLLFAFALLFATAAMAQTRTTYLEESFNGTSIPSGWSVVGAGTNNWSISGTNNAGGQANELHLNWSPQFSGISRFVSPVIDLSGVNSVVISFKHMLDYYESNATLGIATTSNGGSTWNQAWTQPFTTDALGTITVGIDGEYGRAVLALADGNGAVAIEAITRTGETDGARLDENGILGMHGITYGTKHVYRAVLEAYVIVR